MHSPHVYQQPNISEIRMRPTNDDKSLNCVFLVVYKLMVHLTIDDVLELKTQHFPHFTELQIKVTELVELVQGHMTRGIQADRHRTHPGGHACLPNPWSPSVSMAPFLFCFVFFFTES